MPRPPTLPELLALAPSPQATPLALRPQGRGFTPWWLPRGAHASTDLSHPGGDLRPALLVCAAQRGAALLVTTRPDWTVPGVPVHVAPPAAPERAPEPPQKEAPPQGEAPPGPGEVSSPLITAVTTQMNAPHQNEPFGRLIIDRAALTPEELMALRRAGAGRWSVIDFGAPQPAAQPCAAWDRVRRRADYQVRLQTPWNADLEAALISAHWPEPGHVSGARPGAGGPSRAALIVDQRLALHGGPLRFTEALTSGPPGSDAQLTPRPRRAHLSGPEPRRRWPLPGLHDWQGPDPWAALSSQAAAPPTNAS